MSGRGRSVDDGPNRTDVRNMREWLQECTWPDVTSAQIARMPRAQIEGAVDQHYAGGVRQFLRDGGAE